MAASERHPLGDARGAPWRDLPERYGPWSTAWNRLAWLTFAAILLWLRDDFRTRPSFLARANALSTPDPIVMPNIAAPARTHRTEIQMRFADTDALGHLNNVSYAAYAETARLDFMRACGTPMRSLILAHLSIDFVRQVNFGEPIHIESYVTKLGRSSIGIGHVMYAAGERAAVFDSVVVMFDYEAQRAMPIPEDLRGRLAAYMGRETSDVRRQT